MLPLLSVVTLSDSDDRLQIFSWHLEWKMRGLFVLAVAMSASGAAYAAPAGALNKTVSISYGVSGSSQYIGEPTPHGFSSVVTRLVYISSAGRLFVKAGADGGRRGRSGTIAPGEQKRTSFSFQGNKLVGVTKFASGALQIVVSFDSSFSSCTADVIHGRDAGSNIDRIAPNGQRVKILQEAISNVTCSVQAGNSFAH